tara:strand:- start:1036 stop:1158 length:123 start_codon:yes stop_codon:yes gene_type:complete
MKRQAYARPVRQMLSVMMAIFAPVKRAVLTAVAFPQGLPV